MQKETQIGNLLSKLVFQAAKFSLCKSLKEKRILSKEKEFFGRKKKNAKNSKNHVIFKKN